MMADTKEQTVHAKLAMVQAELKVPKGRQNKFGGYSYRNAEDIMEAAKPLCVKHGLLLNCSDGIDMIGTRYYVRAVASVTDVSTGERIEICSYARECDSKKGMDDAQLTGACSSYARKYAMCGLFSIDDTKDMDTEEFSPEDNKLRAWSSLSREASRYKLSNDDIAKILKELCGTDFKTATAEDFYTVRINLDEYMSKKQ